MSEPFVKAQGAKVDEFERSLLQVKVFGGLSAILYSDIPRKYL